MQWRSHLSATLLSLAVAAGGVMAPAARGAEDAGVAPTFKEGDIITYDKIDTLRPFLPPEFWSNRDFFFYEGMKMEVGPFFRDYSPAAEFKAATAKYTGQSKVGRDNSLENYTAGAPFEADQIDCTGDPAAGVKLMWTFDYRWIGAGRATSYYYSYWDRGEELPLFYEGTSRTVSLSHRVEPQYLDKQEGDVFRGEKRKYAFGIEVNAPFDARGIQVLTYRYKDADKPRDSAKNDDTWVYVPTLRRVRRISTAQRTDAVQGTDFTFDDLFSFSGVIPQYEWMCLGEMDLMAPANSKIKAYPFNKDANFGPFGLSYADDRWEMRKAVKIRFTPKNPEHPYHHKDIYIDKQSMEPLYSFAYDQKEELWKVLWHNHRWSEDNWEGFTGWKGIAEPRDLRVVSDTIINVQTGTGNRIEYWDNQGMPMKSKGQIRRFIDVGRLTKGR